jgi:hypothetical protein
MGGHHRETIDGSRGLREWLLRLVRPLYCRENLGEVEFFVDDPPGEVGELEVVAAGVMAEPLERHRRGQLAVLRQDTLGLLDDDPAVQRGLQLLVEHLPTADGSVLKNGPAAAPAVQAEQVPSRHHRGWPAN